LSGHDTQANTANGGAGLEGTKGAGKGRRGGKGWEKRNKRGQTYFNWVTGNPRLPP